jgi:hypothetical protein
MRAPNINVLPKKPGCSASASAFITHRSAFIISSTRFVLFTLLAPAWIVGPGGRLHGRGAASSKLTVTVGLHDAAVTGNDNHRIQTAIDRVAAAGGGTVTIQAGIYTLYNSAPLARHVSLKGEGPEKTLLQKGPGVASPLRVAVISKEYPDDLPSPELYG